MSAMVALVKETQSGITEHVNISLVRDITNRIASTLTRLYSYHNVGFVFLLVKVKLNL